MDDWRRQILEFQPHETGQLFSKGSFHIASTFTPLAGKTRPFVQAPVIWPRAMLDCLDELGKDVATLLHDFGQFIKRMFGLLPMATLEFSQALDLSLLFLARRANDLYRLELV